MHLNNVSLNICNNSLIITIGILKCEPMVFICKLFQITIPKRIPSYNDYNSATTTTTATNNYADQVRNVNYPFVSSDANSPTPTMEWYTCGYACLYNIWVHCVRVLTLVFNNS